MIILLFVAMINFGIATTDDSQLVHDLFKDYSDKVYAKEYEKVKEMYDVDAVMVEKGKRSYYGPEDIVNAIKSYHSSLGDGKTLVRKKNYNEKFEQLSDKFLYFYSDYTTHLVDKVLEGHYWQIWRKNADGQWKILHDEFSIDKQHS